MDTFNIIDTMILMRLDDLPDIHRDPCVIDRIRQEVRSKHGGQRTVERTPLTVEDIDLLDGIDWDYKGFCMGIDVGGTFE